MNIHFLFFSATLCDTGQNTKWYTGLGPDATMCHNRYLIVILNLHKKCLVCMFVTQRRRKRFWYHSDYFQRFSSIGYLKKTL